jgi:hypothetical protein
MAAKVKEVYCIEETPGRRRSAGRFDSRPQTALLAVFSEYGTCNNGAKL